MEQCEECKRYGPCDDHHIVFKGMGGKRGLDFPLNMKKLGSSFGCDCHEGPKGPHHNKKRNLQYKREMQAQLEKILTNDYYTPEEIKKELQISKKQLPLVFKKLMRYEEGYSKEDIITRLMGDRRYD